MNDHGNALSPRHTSVKFHRDQRDLLVVLESFIATLEGSDLEPYKQWIPVKLIGDAAHSFDGQSIYACFYNRHIVFLDNWDCLKSMVQLFEAHYSLLMPLFMAAVTLLALWL